MREKEEKKGKFTKIEFDKTYKSTKEKWLGDRHYFHNVIYRSETDLRKGQILYNTSIEQEIRLGNILFENNKTEVARGICNYLANLDPASPFSIGWHPNYENVLKKEKSVE